MTIAIIQEILILSTKVKIAIYKISRVNMIALLLGICILDKESELAMLKSESWIVIKIPKNKSKNN